MLAENDLIIQEGKNGSAAAAASSAANAAAIFDLSYTLVTQRDSDQKVIQGRVKVVVGWSVLHFCTGDC